MNHQMRIACENGDLAKVTQLVQSGVSVNTPKTDGWKSYPLHIAAWNGNAELTKLLLELGAERTHHDGNGLLPIHIAANKDDSLAIEVVRLLLHKDSINLACIHSQMTALHYAAAKNNLEIVSLLIENGASIQERSQNGNTALHMAIQEAGTHKREKQRYETILRILDAGASMDAVNWLGESPLHAACYYDMPDVVQSLIDAGARIGAEDLERELPIHIAAKSNQPQSIAALLKAGADIDAPDKKLSTPLHHACARNNFESACFLIESGANTKAKDIHGVTAIEKCSTQKLRNWLQSWSASQQLQETFLDAGEPSGKTRHRAPSL